MTLAISGLTPGTAYDARYYPAWGTVNARTADFTLSNGVSSSNINVNEDADTGAHYIDYKYTVGPSGVMSFSEDNDPALMQNGGSWHWYGFSNQYVAPPTVGLPAASAVSVAAGATLDLGRVQQTIASTLTSSGTVLNVGGGLTVTGTATFNAGSNLTLGTVTVSAATPIQRLGTGTINSLVPAAGTAVLGGNVSVGTLDMSGAGNTGTVNSNGNPVTVTNQLKTPDGASLTIAGGQFRIAGANIADSSSSRTLTLSGGTATLSAPPAVATYFKITGDANSGISTNNVYTHAINPSGGGFSVNGVPFTGAGTNNIGPGSLGQQTYTYSGQGGGTVTIGNSISE